MSPVTASAPPSVSAPASDTSPVTVPYPLRVALLPTLTLLSLPPATLNVPPVSERLEAVRVEPPRLKVPPLWLNDPTAASPLAVMVPPLCVRDAKVEAFWNVSEPPLTVREPSTVNPATLTLPLLRVTAEPL